MIGVPWKMPSPPGFVIVIVSPWTSSGRSFFVRAFSAAPRSPARFQEVEVPGVADHGTMRPLPSSSETAIPTCTWSA